MADCPNCGKKVGFMGARKCGVCGNDICKACTKYLTTEKGKGALASKMPQGPAKNALCSDECARKSYEDFEKGIEETTFIDLTNENNDMFFLRERKGDANFRQRTFTIPNAPDGRKRPLGDLIPELVSVHSYMQEDLEKKEHNLIVNANRTTRGGG